MNRQKGTLYLVPTPLGKTPENNTIPEYVLDIVRRLEVFAVENVRSAVRFLQWVGDTVPEYEIEFLQLGKNTPPDEKVSFLKPLEAGRDMGLLSEAGCPVVADPGAELVAMAHSQQIRVLPLTGPSSILLALMASGFEGQRFAFHGYLPIDGVKRKQSIKQLERESLEKKQTQIFMETPHRNDQLLKDVVEACNNPTSFAVAVNLTLPDEIVVSQPISEWKKDTPLTLQKKTAIFLISAG